MNVWRQVTSSVPINSFLVPCIYFQSVKRNYSNGKIYTANVFTSFEQMVQLQRARHSHLVRSVNLRLGFIFHRYKGFLKDCPSGNLNELVSKFWSKFSACKSREKTFLSSSLRHAAFCLFTKLNYIGLRSLLTTPLSTLSRLPKTTLFFLFFVFRNRSSRKSISSSFRSGTHQSLLLSSSTYLMKIRYWVHL